eukprot:996989-Amphidinium_carterae.1
MQAEAVMAVLKRCNMVISGDNFFYQKKACADEDLVPVIPYGGTNDLLDPACKARFAEYKRGTAMQMSQLPWTPKRTSFGHVDLWPTALQTGSYPH